jgi:hypothetical protein
VATTGEADSVLHLAELACRRGDKVEAIVLILEQPSRPAQGAERAKARAAAVDQFLALAWSSSIRSASPYPQGNRIKKHRIFLGFFVSFQKQASFFAL